MAASLLGEDFAAVAGGRGLQQRKIGLVRKEFHASVGIEATVDAAIENIAKGGRIVAVGNFPEKPRFNVALIQDRELSLVGTLTYKHEDYQRAVGLIAAGSVVTAPLETKHLPFERYSDACLYIVAQSGKCTKVFVDL